MTLIGVLSDTHGRLDADAFAALAECDRIIHAGDIGGPHILRELEALAPVTAVLGNNDFNEYGTRVDRFARPVIDGVRLLVAHYPHEVRWGFAGGGESAPGDSIPDICIHGHTHVPELLSGASARPAAYVLCPGSASFPRGGSQRSVAYIEVKDARILEVRIEPVK